MGGWIILAILAALVFFAITIYNRLVASRNRFKNAFAQIDVQLKRRYDLIPNLVKMVKRYMQHEVDVLTRVTMVGTDWEASDGIWTCGKEGQSVPVGVGTPTLKLDGITVGGTEA